MLSKIPAAVLFVVALAWPNPIPATKDARQSAHPFAFSTMGQTPGTILNPDPVCGEKDYSLRAAQRQRQSSPAAGSSQLEFQYVSSALWCCCGGIKVRGNLAYLSFVNGLVIFDVADSANPLVLSRLYFQDGTERLDVEDNYAYLISRRGDLHIVDVSDPLDPMHISSFTDGTLGAMDVEGGFAYVIDSGMLRVIDVSDVYSPVLRGELEISGVPGGLCVRGNRVYIPVRAQGFQVIDATDPDSLFVIGSYYRQVSPSAFTVEGNYAYFYEKDSIYCSYSIVDISNPESLFTVGSFDTTGNWKAHFSHVVNGYAFLACWFDGVFVLDVADPSSPTHVSTLPTPATAAGLFATADYVYAINQVSGGQDESNGLNVVSIKDLANPQVTGMFYWPGWSLGVWVSGRYAYVTHPGRGMQILDVSDVSTPTVLGRFPASYSYEVIVSDTYAYLADVVEDLKVIDVSDALNPGLVASVPIYQAYRIDIQGDFVYVLESGYGLRIVDVTDPFSPFLRGSLEVPGNPEDIDVQGNYAYFAASNEGLKIVDVTDPDNPLLVGNYPCYCLAVDVQYPYAFAVFDSLWILDISDPTDPVRMGSCRLRSNSWHVWVRDNYVYLDGFEVYDVSNPAFPAFAGAYYTPYRADGLYIRGDYLFIADGASFIILRQTPVGVHEEERSHLEDTGIPVLWSSRPNPFVDLATIKYFLTNPCQVSLEVYDTAGRHVRTLVDGDKQSGSYEVVWDGKDGLGYKVPSGIYFYSLQAGDFTDIKKMVLLR